MDREITMKSGKRRMQDVDLISSGGNLLGQSETKVASYRRGDDEKLEVRIIVNVYIWIRWPSRVAPLFWRRCWS